MTPEQKLQARLAPHISMIGSLVCQLECAVMYPDDATKRKVLALLERINEKVKETRRVARYENND